VVAVLVIGEDRVHAAVDQHSKSFDISFGENA